MTTKEYLQKLVLDVKKLEIRENIEDDPHKKAAIKKRKEAYSRIIKRFKQFTTADGEAVDFETATMIE